MFGMHLEQLLDNDDDWTKIAKLRHGCSLESGILFLFRCISIFRKVLAWVDKLPSVVCPLKFVQFFP